MGKGIQTFGCLAWESGSDHLVLKTGFVFSSWFRAAHSQSSWNKYSGGPLRTAFSTQDPGRSVCRTYQSVLLIMITYQVCRSISSLKAWFSAFSLVLFLRWWMLYPWLAFSKEMIQGENEPWVKCIWFCWIQVWLLPTNCFPNLLKTGHQRYPVMFLSHKTLAQMFQQIATALLGPALLLWSSSTVCTLFWQSFTELKHIISPCMPSLP